MPAGSEPRERMWKLSTHSPSAGWSPRRTISQGLVGHPHAALGGQLTQPVQLLGDQPVVVDGVRGHGRAHQDQVGAQLRHHVELERGAAQVELDLLGAHVVEVADRLVQVDRQAPRGAALAAFRAAYEELSAPDGPGHDR